KLNTGFTIRPGLANRPVRALSLISADDAPERDPASFVLEGSFDGTNFPLIASNEVPPFIARHSIQSFNIANAIAYPVYRVTFPTGGAITLANSIQIAEVELLASPKLPATNDAASATLPAGANEVNGVANLFDRQLDYSAKLKVESITNADTVVHITL